MLTEDKPKLVAPAGPQDHADGPEGARVTVVEYGDYECPGCASATQILHKLRERFGDDLRVVFRHFPMYSVHKAAGVAAQAAEAAAAQGKFWAMHDLLFTHQDDLADMDLGRLAIKADLDVYRFNDDLATEAHAPRVAEHVESAKASGVTGTPTLFLNNTRFRGGIHIDELRDDIESLLNA